MDINNLERKTKAELFELIQSKQAEIEHRTQVSAELAGELIRKRAEIDALNRKVDKIREVIEEQYGELDYWADVAFDHVIEELDK